MIATKVLIVGCGPAGLTSSMLLSSMGISNIVIEKRSEISKHPRAIGFTSRTIEIFRTLGLTEQDIPSAPKNFRLVRKKVESLAGKHLEESHWNGSGAQKGGGGNKGPKQHDEEKSAIDYSFVRGAAIAQDRLEAVLMKRAKELGADIRMAHTLQHFTQEKGETGGIHAVVLDQNGNTIHFEASYMIAADGHRSPIRTALGIERKGRGHIRTIRSVLFHAPALDTYLATGTSQFSICQPDFTAFVTTYGDSRWALMFEDDQVRSHKELDECIVKAAGRDDFQRSIIATGRWEMSALIAQTFSVDRIFLAGDAAHTLPPNRGGYGANTGIEDAHNMAWKLAAVINSRAPPSLLQTYDVERRPVAWLRLKQIFARPDYQQYSNGISDDVAIIDDDAMEFGHRYVTAKEQVTIAEARRPEEWKGRIGTRAPHAWITLADKDGNEKKRISTLELMNNKWLLLSTSSTHFADTSLWSMKETNVNVAPIETYQIGSDIYSDSTNLLNLYDLQQGESILIRPDGYIAWKGVLEQQTPKELIKDSLCL